MNFDLSEEQRLLQDAIRQLLESELPVSKLREVFESDSGHDEVLWKNLVEMGLCGLAVPEQYGGAGLELLDLALATETLAYGGAPGPFFGHSLAALALALGGSEAQQAKWLPKLAGGDAIGSIALAEPGSRWQPEEWRLEAGATLEGAKLNVPYPELADIVVVGVAGGGLVLVEPGSGGVEIQKISGVDRARRLGGLVFTGTACEALPGGASASARLRDAALVLLAADAFGAGSRLVDMCVSYAKTREQFGVTIGHFQALKHQLADMAVDMEPSRALYWYAAHAFDHLPDEAARSAAIAKAHITDTAMQVARDAVEAHGGIGFTWECDVQLWFKRVMFDRAFFGQPSVHRRRQAELAGW